MSKYILIHINFSVNNYISKVLTITLENYFNEVKKRGITYAQKLLHWSIVVTLMVLGTLVFASEVKAQPPAMSNMQNVTRISSETIMVGYVVTIAYNPVVNETYSVIVQENGNLKISNQISMNTSEFQGLVNYYVTKDTRDIYLSEDISIIPEQKTDLFLGTEIANAQFNSTPHEMNIMANVMHKGIYLPEVTFEYKTREQANLGGKSVNLKVYNTSSVFYYTG